MQLYDVKSAARILCISPFTVRSYVRRGKLRPVRLGRRVLFEERELQEFIAANRQGENGKADDVPVMV